MDYGVAYRCPNGVDNEAPAAFMVLPSVRNEDRHLGPLVEDLLYTAVIDALADMASALGLRVVLIHVIVAETISACVTARLV